ncbi:MAG: hypothetical protein ABSB28_02760 [Candidatus Bathyarchaeia archaeon]
MIFQPVLDKVLFLAFKRFNGRHQVFQRVVWPHNPMGLLPVDGDEYRYVIAQVRK